MNKFFSIIFLSLMINFSSFADMEYEPIVKSYIVEDHIFIVSDNGFLHELYLCKPTAEKCKFINKHFAFSALAKSCNGIDTKNIYFARNKEHFFMGGINENAPLRIYDFEGNVYGSAPDMKYATSYCEFYKESK